MGKYEEALERAKQGLPIDEVFPELKESESEDERVRKEIVKFVATVKDIAKSGRNSWAVRKEDVEMCERFLTYLEKQKDERELSFIEGKMEGVRQTCQEIKDAMSLFEPKDLTPFESTFRDYIDSAIRYCLAGEGYQQYIKEWAADLLNLEKQKEQKPAEWSEEDKSYYDTIVCKLEVIGDDSGLSNNQIKFLREHYPSHCSEWSEEDEEMLQNVYESLYAYQCDIRAGKMDKNSRDLLDDVEREKKWLKSLHPQPHWKPSEDQMKALNEVANNGVLLDLFNDLLKLL